jgi:peptidoglycan pentaglycine glycine transferase (the first glycine)
MISGKPCDDAVLWDDTVHSMRGHPLQLWGWGELKAAHNWIAHRLLFVDDGGVVRGAAQLLVRRLPGPFRRLVYVPRGPMWQAGRDDQVFEALVMYVRHHLPGTVLSVEPDVPQLSLGSEWRRTSHTILLPRTIILDLDTSLTDLQGAMTKKTRQYIRKSTREDLTFRQVKTPVELMECLDIYHQTARRAGFDLHTNRYYEDVHHFLGDSSVIFAAFHREKPVAFVWLALSATTAFELYGGMNGEGQELRANYGLKWHAITTCKQWGIARYDMNGLLNDGVSSFKQGFASHEDILVGTYDYPLSPLYAVWSKGLPVAKKAVRTLKSLRK